MANRSDDLTRSESLTDLVIRNVKQLISSGELRAGDRLPIEKDLAARWGVSRGTLREGVRALVTLGALETRQGDGTYVTKLDPGELLRPLGFFADIQETGRSSDLLAIRRVLETESAGLAAVRLTPEQLDELEAVLAAVDPIVGSDDADDAKAFIEADAEFHRIIAAAGGNVTLAALIENLMGQTLRARLWRAITERDSVSVAHAEHRAILAALRAQEPERARIRMAAHLLGVEEFASEHPTAPSEAQSADPTDTPRRAAQ